jgi:hypothetical protein
MLVNVYITMVALETAYNERKGVKVSYGPVASR